jgi:hypothetical protein
MERSRLDQVYVNVAGTLVEIAWAERDWLLEKIRVVAGFESIVRKLDAVGRPVELDFDERARLRAPLEFWGELPDGLARLLDALVQAAPGGHGKPPTHA